jgi:hypothetical protein
MTTAGNVYVYNVYSETLQLSLNGGPAGTINDWTVASPPPKYQPNCLVVPRTLNSSDGFGKFFQGKDQGGHGNQVTVHWMEQPITFEIILDHNLHPLPEDLLLFVTGNSYSLVTQFGGEAAHGTFGDSAVVSPAGASGGGEAGGG